MRIRYLFFYFFYCTISLLSPKAVAADSCGYERFGVNVDFRNSRANPSNNDLSDLGSKWLRVEFQTKSDFTAAKNLYKKELQRVNAAGMKSLLIVGYALEAGKPNSTQTDPAAWDKYFDGFFKKLEEIVPLLDAQVDAWQIWNESDMPYNPGYDPGVPANIFGKKLVKAAQIIKKYSTKPIVAAGMGAGLFSYYDNMVKAAGKDWTLIDAAALHPYGQRAPNDFPKIDWGFGNMKSLFDVYLQLGHNKPLWISEIGIRGVSADQQAQYVENVYKLAETYGDRVPKVFWFCWSDGMVSEYGLKDAADKSKKAYERFKSLAKAAKAKACP